MTSNTDQLAKFAIFDMDGVLLDTETIYTEVTQEIVQQYGKTFDWSIKANMIGRAALDSARYLVEALSLPISAESYLETRDEMLRMAFPKCRRLPGAEALIRRFSQMNVPIAVATSSSKEMFSIKTSRHQDLFQLFDEIVTFDDPEVKDGKPAPDIFNVAASRLGAIAAQTLVFEDAPSGLAAGIAAGMRVIAIPDPNMDKARYQDATAILDSLEDFRPEEFGYSGQSS